MPPSVAMLQKWITDDVPLTVPGIVLQELLAGVRKACQKRPVSPKAMDDLVDHIIAAVTAKFENEVPGEFIGTMVMDGLRDIDSVAYVRFASVYRRFQEATDFVQEVRNLEAAR